MVVAGRGTRGPDCRVLRHPTAPMDCGGASSRPDDQKNRGRGQPDNQKGTGRGQPDDQKNTRAAETRGRTRGDSGRARPRIFRLYCYDRHGTIRFSNPTIAFNHLHSTARSCFLKGNFLGFYSPGQAKQRSKMRIFFFHDISGHQAASRPSSACVVRARQVKNAQCAVLSNIQHHFSSGAFWH